MPCGYLRIFIESSDSTGEVPQRHAAGRLTLPRRQSGATGPRPSRSPARGQLQRRQPPLCGNHPQTGSGRGWGTAVAHLRLQDSAAGENAILSCAFGTRDINYSAEVWDAIDIVNVMTYDIADQDGYHSSFWGCGPQAAVYYESLGVDRKKLNLGIPFYGTQIHALMEQYLYCDLKNHTSYDYYRNIYLCPDYLGKDMTPVYFNSPSMVRDKTAYALLSGMGGSMVWHTALDTDYSSEYSLWRAVATALEIYGGEQ